MKRIACVVVAVVLSVTGVVARPVSAASMWRAWQGCNGATQFGNWVPHGGVSYTAYCNGSVTGGHGCSGGPTGCYLFWQSDGGSRIRTAAIPG